MTLIGYADSYYKDFFRDLAEDRLRGIALIHDFGHNDAFGTTTETLFTVGGLYYWLPSAQQVTIVSDSAEDSATGTGAREVKILGLDGSYEGLEETISTNGTTAVTTTNNFLRILSFEVEAAGSNESNAGTVELKDNAQTNTIELIEPGKGISHSATWTVPNNRTSYLVTWFGSELSNKGIKMDLWVRNIDTNVWKEKRLSYLVGTQFERKFTIPYIVPAKSDVEMRVTGLGQGSQAAGGFSGY